MYLKHPHQSEFKYVGALFKRHDRMEQELNRWIWASSAVIQTLRWSFMVKKELSFVYWSVNVLTLISGHEIKPKDRSGISAS